MAKRSYQKGAELALVNGDLFMQEAETVFERQSYGHAMGLAILGIEELAKAEIYMRAKEGVRRVPNLETLTRAGTYEYDGLQRVESDHEIKYRQFIHFLSLSRMVTFGLGFAAARKHRLLGTVIDEQVKAKTFDRNRQTALYVSYGDGKWHSPSSVAKIPSGFFVLYGSRYARWVAEVVQNGWTAKMGSIRDSIKDPQEFLDKVNKGTNGEYDLEHLLGP